jgi:hypothetical protein
MSAAIREEFNDSEKTLEARIVELRRTLTERSTTARLEKAEVGPDHPGHYCEYQRVGFRFVDINNLPEVIYTEFLALREAWKIEITAENERRILAARQAAIAEIEARKAAAAAEIEGRKQSRATMSREELAAELGIALPNDAGKIVSDNGQGNTAAELILKGERTGIIQKFYVVKRKAVTTVFNAGKAEEEVKYNFENKLTTLALAVEDGLLLIKEREWWCAKVIDPSLPEPKFDFLKRTSGGGGYINIQWQAGDIMVCGRRTKKWTNEFSLIYLSTNEEILTVEGTYAALRKLRKLILASVPIPAAVEPLVEASEDKPSAKVITVDFSRPSPSL